MLEETAESRTFYGDSFQHLTAFSSDVNLIATEAIKPYCDLIYMQYS